MNIYTYTHIYKAKKKITVYLYVKPAPVSLIYIKRSAYRLENFLANN